ncbi:GGDEF domain-containing protein [Vibrio sp. PP-XX7]
MNDEFGHHAGDLVLKYLVRTLNGAVRKTDMLFRLGGEEFVILLPMQNAESARQLAERLREIIEVTAVGVGNSSVAYTVSMGVTEYHDGDDEEGIFKRVDSALYQAKTCGRNQVRLM